MSLLKHTATGLVCAVIAGLAVHQFTATPEAVSVPAPASRPAQTPVAPPPAVLAPAAPDPRLAELAAENADLRARLAAEQVRTTADAAALKQTRDKLAELRRPLTADVISSTLRASVKPGEMVVTGGSRMADGRRLFVFVSPATEATPQGDLVQVGGQFLSVPDDVARAVGLDSMSTDVANTLQHGEVWTAAESAAILSKLESTEGVMVLSGPKLTLRAGHEATFTVGRADMDGLSLKVAPSISADRSGLELELRMELNPVTPPPAAPAP